MMSRTGTALRRAAVAVSAGAALTAGLAVGPSQVNVTDSISVPVVGAAQEAEALVYLDFRSGPSSHRQMRVHFGPWGTGDTDYLNPGDYTELSAVGSVRCHKGYKLQSWSKLLRKYQNLKDCKKKGGYYNFWAPIPTLTVREVRA